ncbi:hypothetical protein GJ496_011232 [Pomphorhynchus laevis]|nr:hypothetical protein GJ496_011232 [Pomphorhynchus laevis]
MPKMHSTGSKDNTLSKSTKPDKRGRVLSKDPSISTDVEHCDIQIARDSERCDFWTIVFLKRCTSKHRWSIHLRILLCQQYTRTGGYLQTIGTEKYTLCNVRTFRCP